MLCFRAHTFWCSLKNSPPTYPQIAQGKQCADLRSVLGQTLVAQLGESKQAFDGPKQMHHLFTKAGLHLFSGLPSKLPLGRVIVQCPARLPGRVATCAKVIKSNSPLAMLFCFNGRYVSAGQWDGLCKCTLRVDAPNLL